MNRIRQLRQNAGLSQVELARRIGCLQSTLSDIETGKQDPKQTRLEAIARALNIPVSYLFDEPSPSAKNPAAPR